MKKVILFSFMLSILNSCVSPVNVVTPTPSSSASTSDNSSVGNDSGSNAGTVGTDPISTGGNLEVKAPTALNISSFNLSVSANSTETILNKVIFKPEEEMKIKLNVPDSYYEGSAWLGVFNNDAAGGDSKTNDANDIDYIYINKVKGMEFVTIKAPVKAGIYELRLNDGNEEDSKEISRIKFLVSNSETITDNKIKLSKNSFKKGEKFTVEYETALEIMNLKPWLGVVPSNIPHVDATLNDANDIDYKYIDGRNKATLIFDSANYAVGKYDIRLNDNDNTNGKEIIFISFEITE